MTRQLARVATAGLLAAALAAFDTASVQAQSARDTYAELQQREQQALASIEATAPDASSATRSATQRQARAVITAYDGFASRYRSSGYGDNALFNAAGVAESLHARFGRVNDRTTALRLYRRLLVEHPSSSLIARATPKITALEAAETPVVAAAPAAPRPEPASTRATLTAIDRTVMPEAVRVTLSLDREVPYREERLAGPPRVFFDLKGVQTTADLLDAVLRYPSDAVRQIRVGRHPDSTVRVVLDLDGVDKYSVFTLYNPFRVVIDFETATTTAVATTAAPAVVAPPPVVRTVDVVEPPPTVTPLAAAGRIDTAPPTFASPKPPDDAPVGKPTSASPRPPDATVGKPTSASPAPSDATAGKPLVASAPAAPSAPKPTTGGGFSLSRQLGLGVSRIVIDPGHGGHDPGAHVKGLTEADLTLDIALRLEKLLQEEGGIEVVLTRRTNVYIPLEERTAIATRESADLFLSIHANASRNAAARGVETYYLSFASSPDAEAVAARENSASAGEMSKLPDMIKAIALNNKLDESKDLAGMVQEALVTRLRRANRNLRNLGVKKAPFVVLIGAGVPSVLAEVSFLTNKQEATLLKSAAYKQRIAEALHAAVMRYKRSLKGAAAVAER
jgi:N-acetylmuramoyl-L-alanine amidase